MERTTTTSGRVMARVSLWTLGAGLAAALAVASPAAAQERGADCHCVDRDGNRIEDCVCLTTPSRDGVFTLAPFARRAVVGVTIDYTQGPEVDAEGAEIQAVQPDGPADRAGLQAGDIVVRIDGRSVFDPLEPGDERGLSESQSVPVQRFVRLVGALEPDEPVEIEYLRDGRVRTATLSPEAAEGPLASFPGLTLFEEGLPGVAWRFDRDELRSDMESLQERLREQGWTPGEPGVFRFEGPGREGEVRIFGGEPGRFDAEPFVGRFRTDPCIDLTSGGDGPRVWVFGGSNCVAGAEFIELNPELGEYFGTDEGVLVARVAEESTLGLRAGDVLLQVDGREVRTPEHALRILGSYEAGEEVRLRVLRKGAETEVLGRRK